MSLLLPWTVLWEGQGRVQEWLSAGAQFIVGSPLASEMTSPVLSTSSSFALDFSERRVRPRVKELRNWGLSEMLNLQATICTGGEVSKAGS